MVGNRDRVSVSPEPEKKKLAKRSLASAHLSAIVCATVDDPVLGLPFSHIIGALLSVGAFIQFIISFKGAA